ncbi:MAG: putative transcriptional regulator [Candidatus Alkanophagales archaeon MCA70_species_1]|nr:putative transcriptional regulator [Candidatus Alkanophaga volatiphilum]
MAIELTPIQKQILLSLISLYRREGRAIRGEEIAALIGRNPGTIRNQMQTLKSLGLVEGVPGPKGGYKATGKAYEVLEVSTEKEAPVPVSRNGKPVDGVTVEEIEFKMVRHPEVCTAHIKMIGDIKDFDAGDIIEVGPTPVNKVVLKGEVVGRDDIENVVICNIMSIISLPKKKVIEYVEGDLVKVPATATIQEASRILLKNNVDRAVVTKNDEIIGILSFKDICKAIASGKLNIKAKDLAKKKLITIEGDRSVYEAVQLVNRYGVGSLLVMQNGKPVGLVPRTSLLREFSVYK